MSRDDKANLSRQKMHPNDKIVLWGCAIVGGFALLAGLLA